MRLIAYARVSTGDQQTIENQIEKIRTYCELHEHELTGNHNQQEDKVDINQLTDLYGLEWVDYIEYLPESTDDSQQQENENDETKTEMEKS